MTDYAKLFTDARDYLVATITPTIDCYLTGIWDPYIKYIIIKETNEIIDKDLAQKFPTLPSKLRPQVKFRIFEDELNIECGIQNFLNPDTRAVFLGTAVFADATFDFYYRVSYDPRFDHVFIARYGHDISSFLKGSKTAKVEYKTGQYTPLAMAYGMACEDGYIK
jgi:hypothetical protein